MATGFTDRFKGKIKAAVIYLKSANSAGLSGIFLDGIAAMIVYQNAGAPTNGTSGTLAGVAQPGALLVDNVGLALYQNTNTLLSPTWSIKEGTGGQVILPAADALTAYAGGGQTSALALTAQINRISTVATAGDSVKLPAAAAGLFAVVINDAANPMQVFGAGTDTINDVATATGVSQLGKSAVLYGCSVTGKWYSVGAGVVAPVVASAIYLDTGTKTAAATGGAATLNKMSGVITSESLTTAAGASYALTLTDSNIAAADQVMASVQNGSNTAGIPVVSTVMPGAGSVVIVVENNHLTAAFNGTIKIAFVVFKN